MGKQRNVGWGGHFALGCGASTQSTAWHTVGAQRMPVVGACAPPGLPGCHVETKLLFLLPPCPKYWDYRCSANHVVLGLGKPSTC